MKSLDTDDQSELKRLWGEQPYNKTTKKKKAEKYDKLNEDLRGVLHSSKVQNDHMSIIRAVEVARRSQNRPEVSAEHEAVNNRERERIQEKIRELETEREAKIDGMNHDDLVDHIMEIVSERA